VDRVAEETRKHLVAHAEDHHHHEPDEVHVGVRGAVHDPRGMDRHRQSHRDTRGEPEQARSDERLREPIHYRVALERAAGRR
jgi:hypothetical protein